MHHGMQIIVDWIVSTPKIAVYITDNFAIFMLQVVVIINDVLRFDLISILLKEKSRNSSETILSRKKLLYDV